MNDQNGLFFELTSQIVDLIDKKQKIYLVGGAVRDHLLNRPIYDWDFVMEGNVIPFAKKTANHFGGAFFLLDSERNIARVLINDRGLPLVFDFASLRGQSLVDDLSRRDFTVNAMAIDLAAPGTVIDYLNGKNALHERVLIPCSPQGFIDDPVRVLRTIRLSLGLGFSIAPQSTALIADAVSLIDKVSAERKRDELFKIFETGRSREAILWMDGLGLFGRLFPELEKYKSTSQSAPHIYTLWDHILNTIDYLDKIIQCLLSVQEIKIPGLSQAVSIEPILKFSPPISSILIDSFTSGRKRKALLVFSALLHDCGKVFTQTVDDNGRIRFLGHEKKSALDAERIAGEWVLSRQEVDYIGKVVKHHMRIHFLTSESGLPDNRSLHRYFRDVGEFGIDVALHSLADSLATWGPEIPPEKWKKELDIVTLLLETWFNNKDEVVYPPRLLSGEDIIRILNIPPGPLVGRLILDLQEAQVAGQVLTGEDAVHYINTTYRQSVEGAGNDRISPH